MHRTLLTKAFLLAIALAAPQSASAAEPIWDANTVEMTSERLADGVYAFYPVNARALNASGGAAATSSGLIVGTRGAALIETLLNERLNAQVLALSERLGGQNMRYAINTSAHGDHSYGNMYLPDEVSIVQHQNSQRYVVEHLDDDKAFMLKNFGEGRGIEPIVARTGDILVPPLGRVSLDLGGKTVEVIDFGFAQTGGDLFVWQPESKVLWAGNAIIAAKPALPWLLDGHLVETLETLLRVQAFLPADARIVPGHGVAISRDELQWQIDYLTAVKTQVQQAIDLGLSLEETVKAVALPEFRGYVLFDWVHPQLNVPAAYEDLSKQAR